MDLSTSFPFGSKVIQFDGVPPHGGSLLGCQFESVFRDGAFVIEGHCLLGGVTLVRDGMGAVPGGR